MKLSRAKWSRMHYGFRNLKFNQFLIRYIVVFIKKFVYFDILNIFLVQSNSAEPDTSANYNQYDILPLTEHQCREVSEDLDYEMTISFVEGALAKGDTCFGVFENQKLLSYAWYSSKPTRIMKELEIQFDNSFIYGYKSFVLPQYRGRGLNTLLVAGADKEFIKLGYKGTIGYVSSFNFNAIRPFHRKGNMGFGRIILIGKFWKYIIYHTTGCKQYDLRVKIMKDC